MKRIGLLAACDRDNYGDILFPIIFENYFRNKLSLKFNYYGLIKSDISNLGGPKTDAIKEIKKDENDIIVICGGDTIGIPWAAAFTCFDNSEIEKKTAKFLRKIFKLKGDKLISYYMFKEKMWAMPYNLPKEYIKKSKIIYNCVSSSALNYLEAEYKISVKKTLSEADYIAVREIDSKKILQNIGITKKINVYPDSAILMSIFYPNEVLEKLLKEKFTINYLKKLNDYIVFQIAENYSSGYIQTLIIELKKIYEKTKLKIVLLPIGKAKGHSDQIPLKKIYEELKGKIDIEYIDTENVFETMYVLGNTELYIGTSLHGAITALSFGRRHIALTSKVKKLLEFLSVWSIRETPYFSEIEDLSRDIDLFLKQDLLKIKENQKVALEKADENFQNILKIIKE